MSVPIRFRYFTTHRTILFARFNTNRKFLMWGYITLKLYVREKISKSLTKVIFVCPTLRQLHPNVYIFLDIKLQKGAITKRNQL